MDATAQAELVRSRRGLAGSSSSTPRSRGSRRSTRELNAVIHALFEEARAEAASTSCPTGPSGASRSCSRTSAPPRRPAAAPGHAGCSRRPDFRAPVDTYLAAALPRRRASSSIGKTNTPELGILPTTEPDAYGATRNPWDTRPHARRLERRLGGGGRRGDGPVAHANDGGGSIRIPASICGLVGLKPTRQRISEGPLIGDNMSGLTVELVVSRSVRDTAAMLDAVHGPAPGDPYVAPPPARPYVEELDAEPGQLRIGVIDAARPAEPRRSIRSASTAVARRGEAARVARPRGRGGLAASTPGSARRSTSRTPS